MARTNDGLVYPEGKLFICRTLGASTWEVRNSAGVVVTKEPTEKGGQRTVFTRSEEPNGVLESGISKGIDARCAAVRHQVEAGTLTAEQGQAQLLKLKPPKAAK